MSFYTILYKNEILCKGSNNNKIGKIKLKRSAF